MIQFTSIERGPDRNWVFTWNDTGADFYRIVFRGEQVGRTSATSWRSTVPNFPNYPPPIEVVEEDYGERALSEQFPPTILFQWYDVSNTISYQVDEKTVVSPETWTRRGRIVDNPNSMVYTFQSRRLEDESFHEYRLYSINSVRATSDPVYFEGLVVTPPNFIETNLDAVYVQATSSIIIQEV